MHLEFDSILHPLCTNINDCTMGKGLENQDYCDQANIAVEILAFAFLVFILVSFFKKTNNNNNNKLC